MLLFHVADTSVRRSIETHGLRPPGSQAERNWRSEGESDGVSVYLLGSVEDARDWAEYMWGTRFDWDAFDIWAVAADGLPLVCDPHMPDGYDSYRCAKPIPAARLTLVEQVRCSLTEPSVLTVF